MQPRFRGHRGIWFVAGFAVAIVASALLLRPAPHQQPQAFPSATSPSPASSTCKPLPPVQVTLTAAGRGIWRIHLEAASPIQDAVLRLGSGGPGAEDRVTVVWRGTLSAGETRDVEALYEAPAGDGQVWAELAADERGAALQRSRATLHTRAGLAIVTQEAADLGTVVTDPQSGTAVVEYPGSTGVGR